MPIPADRLKDLAMICPACGARLISGGRVCPGCERCTQDDMPPIPAAEGLGFVLAAGILGYLIDSTQGVLIGTGMGVIALALAAQVPIDW